MSWDLVLACTQRCRRPALPCVTLVHWLYGSRLQVGLGISPIKQRPHNVQQKQLDLRRSVVQQERVGTGLHQQSDQVPKQLFATHQGNAGSVCLCRVCARNRQPDDSRFVVHPPRPETFVTFRYSNRNTNRSKPAPHLRASSGPSSSRRGP